MSRTERRQWRCRPTVVHWQAFGGLLMNTDGTDWAFNTAREGTIPKGDFGVFCVFLVWMTYRRTSRRNRKRDAEDMALHYEIAHYHRERRQQERR